MEIYGALVPRMCAHTFFVFALVLHDRIQERAYWHTCVGVGLLCLSQLHLLILSPY